MQQFALFGVAMSTMIATGFLVYLGASRRFIFWGGVPWTGSVSYMSWTKRDEVNEEIRYIQRMKELRK